MLLSVRYLFCALEVMMELVVQYFGMVLVEGLLYPAFIQRDLLMIYRGKTSSWLILAWNQH